MAGRPRVAVAGHICLDITPIFPAGRARRVEELLVPGKLVHMEGISLHTGGCVANTGLALKELGAEVSLMGKVGEDGFGTLVRAFLEGCGAAEGLITVPGERTSYSVVLSPPGIDRIFLHDPGANDTFSAADLDFAGVAGHDLFHFGYPPILRRMYADGGAELAGLLRAVKELGVPTSVDLAAVDPETEAGRADWTAILRRALPWVDYFVPSAEELAFMVDRPLWERWNAAGGDPTEAVDLARDLPPLAARALEWGAGAVLIKCGARGLYYRDGRGQYFQESYRPERICSATGAGDTAIASFLLSVLRGLDTPRCLALAAAAGAACVAAYDALGGLCAQEALEARIDGGWETQPQALPGWRALGGGLWAGPGGE